MELDPNFSEFLGWLREHEARFLIVGGYAVALHGHPRYTADLDVWVAADDRNAQAVLSALRDFGFDELGLTPEDFTTPNRVVQLGYPPVRIDLMTSIDGIDFDEAERERVDVRVGAAIVPFISLRHLRQNKAVTGRAQDLADLEALPEER